MQSMPIVAAQQILQRTIPTLERQFDDAIAAKPAALDFVVAAVQIIDSAGLNWLLACNARLEILGIKLRLIDPSPLLADILAVTRLDTRFLVLSNSDIHNAGGGLNGRG